jgi:hypothetical protein
LLGKTKSEFSINLDECDPSITILLNSFSDITQAPPPAQKLALPSNLVLPPVSAAKSSGGMSFEALESLLSTDNTITTTAMEQNEFILDSCASPSSSSTINTPKDNTEISWIEDFDVLFGVDIAQSKFDPLLQDGDTEFDSLLGI